MSRKTRDDGVWITDSTLCWCEHKMINHLLMPKTEIEQRKRIWCSICKKFCWKRNQSLEIEALFG